MKLKLPDGYRLAKSNEAPRLGDLCKYKLSPNNNFTWTTVTNEGFKNKDKEYIVIRKKKDFKLNINDYVKQNWDELPKSSFDSDSVVIVKEIKNDEEGYGHHSYEGLGVNQAGEFMWCYSSGCSCNGSCGTDHRKELKTLQVDGKDFNVSDLDYKTINFKDLQVTFTSY